MLYSNYGTTWLKQGHLKDIENLPTNHTKETRFCKELCIYFTHGNRPLETSSHIVWGSYGLHLQTV